MCQKAGLLVKQLRALTWKVLEICRNGIQLCRESLLQTCAAELQPLSRLSSTCAHLFPKFFGRLLEACEPKWVPIPPSFDASGRTVRRRILRDKRAMLWIVCLNSHPFNGIQNPGQYRNGWGFVVLTGSGFRFGSGCVPAEVGRLFSSRKLRTAYTSLLEIMAQILRTVARVAFCFGRLFRASGHRRLVGSGD